MQTQMKMKNLWTILQILEQAQISLEITDTDGNTTLWENADVFLYMRLYATFDYVTPSASSDTDAAFATDFIGAWSTFLEVRIPEISRAYHAMDSLYDPISNYDMHEFGADGTRNGTQTDTVTPHGRTTVETTPTGSEITESTTSRAGFNSSGFENSDKMVTEIKPGTTPRKTTTETFFTNADTETKHTFTNDQAATADGTTISGVNTASEHILTRSGNIGVTTSQQMIQSEIDLRKNNLLRDVVKEFIMMHCILVG